MRVRVQPLAAVAIIARIFPHMNQGFSFIPRLTFLALAVSITTLTPVSLQAQIGMPIAPASRKIVRDVQFIFKGGAKVDEARLRSQMSTREGQPLSDELVERDIRALYGTGIVENLDIRAVDVPGGVRVIVEVSGRGGVGEIIFVGNSAFDGDRLRKETEIKIGDPVDDIKLTEAQKKIVEMYEKKGFTEVAITYDVTPSTREGFSTVAFKIDEGARGIINDIRFEGNTAISSRKLRQKLKSSEHHFWNLWGKAGKLKNDELQEDIKTIELAFQDEGYVYAKVLEVRREPVSAKKLDLVFVIQEGGRYDVSGVSLSGNTIFQSDTLMAGIKTEPNFPYVASFVQADEKRIRDYYGSRGYADARVETSLLETGPGQVKVAFNIYEGTKSYINKVNISGNAHTEDRVIRRELPFAPGEELNTVKIAAGKSRLEGLGYFGAVDVRNNPAGAEGFKDVDITVAEQSTGTVNFGAGFTSIDSITGFLSVTQTNFDILDWKDFRGAGQRFNANLQGGALRRNATISWTEPWFLGRELELTLQAFYQGQFFLTDKYDQNNAGMAASLRKRTGEHSFILGTLTLQQVEIANLNPASSALIRSEAGSFVQSKVDISWVHDTRDNLFLIRRGHKLEAGISVSALDVETYGVNLGGQQYYNLVGDSILSFEGYFRHVQNWGGSRVPIFDRLFLGGANDLRGFGFRGAGPREATGEPIGGLTSVYATAEYNVPVNIIGAHADKAPRLAVFGDIGSISGANGSIVGNGDIYSDIGLGLRFIVPFLGPAPVRLDYAIPMDRDQFSGSSSGRWQFNLGYKF